MVQFLTKTAQEDRYIQCIQLPLSNTMNKLKQQVRNVMYVRLKAAVCMSVVTTNVKYNNK